MRMQPSIARSRIGTAVQPTDVPQSTTLGLHPVVHKLLLISRPTEGRRQSWPKLTEQYVSKTYSRLLANHSNSQPESHDYSLYAVPQDYLHR